MLDIIISIQSEDISNAQAKRVVSALNTQLKDHFGPAWHIVAKSRLIMGPVDPVTTTAGAVLVVADEAHIEGALGYHDRIVETGLPIGFVFEDICRELGEPWSVTLSHELLELCLNSMINDYCVGPHPTDRKRNVWHWKEACDAVQDQTYTIRNVEVSDFVLPHFFTPERENNEKVNFLETPGLRSFDVTAGGYLGFFDPKIGRETTYFKSEIGKKRSAIKQKMKQLRRKEKVLSLLKKL